MVFEKDSWQRAMMGDFYHLTEKYWIVPADKRDDDDFWDELIKDTDDFCRKYARDDDRFAIQLALLLIQHAEDQVKGKLTLCEVEEDSAVTAIMNYLLNGGGRCQSTNRKTDAGLSG